jgi:bacterioferritin (cytochrome b1)
VIADRILLMEGLPNFQRLFPADRPDRAGTVRG